MGLGLAAAATLLALTLWAFRPSPPASTEVGPPATVVVLLPNVLTGAYPASALREEVVAVLAPRDVARVA